MAKNIFIFFSNSRAYNVGVSETRFARIRCTPWLDGFWLPFFSYEKYLSWPSEGTKKFQP